jgi:hydroxymethylbilane synthase
MSNREIIIGTRGSKLALIQTQIVVKNLLLYNPDINIKVRVIKTSGDRGNLTALGAFVGEIERALLDKEIDIAVHSLKDMPAKVTEGLRFAAILKREDVREVLILKKGEIFNQQKGYTFGTGSPRRQLLLKHYFPEINVVFIHGNVDSRIAMVDSGKVDGVILAAAGIIRIGMSDRISEYLPVNTFIPPPGQGAMAVQTRISDHDMIKRVTPLDDKNTRICTITEHIILNEISAGCSVPLGAYAEYIDDEYIRLTAFYGYNASQKINTVQEAFHINEAATRSKLLAKNLKKNYNND